MKPLSKSQAVFASTAMAAMLTVGLASRAIGQAAAQEPAPKAVDAPVGAPPADAVVIFDGKSMANLRGEGHDDPRWKLGKGYMEVSDTGGLFSKEEFGDAQIHVEWMEPTAIEGDGQARGNSGVYLMGRWEVQVLDSYNNPTYPNGQCGALYGRSVPLVNVCRKPGEWQTYDMIFHPPKNGADGQVINGTLTVFQNGVLIQDHVPVSPESTGSSPLHGVADQGPLYLQDHAGNKVRFRNVWVRRL